MDYHVVKSETLLKSKALFRCSKDNPYCVIASLAIWVFSFIYFIDFGYFILFSGEEQTYLFIFVFITDDSCFA